MDGWIGYALALGAFIVIAPAIAWLARRQGRSVKGGLLLASVLLGFGEPLDPPSKHMIEASGGEEREGESTGEPKDASGGS